MNERRTKRSAIPSEALLFLLQSLAETHDLSAIVVANPEGKLVAGVSDSERGFLQLAELAAAARGAADTDLSDDLYAFSVDVEGKTFYLGTLGARPRRVRDAENAMRRILRNTSVTHVA